MSEIMNGADFEQRLSDLAHQSSDWFRKHQHIGMPMRLVLYVAESQSGSLKKYYARLLDDSLECLISLLPVIANRLAAEISLVSAVSRLQIRPLLGLIVYWLISAHTDKSNVLPERDQMLDIFSSILSGSFLAFQKI